MALVDIETIRKHCRADDPDDSLLEIYKDAAEQAAQDYLNRRVYATEAEMEAAIADGSAGENPMVINPAIFGAILLIAGHLNENREENVTGTIVAELKFGARALLRPHRIVPGV